ncbi:MAG: hypothetical protein WBD51_10315 [Burkholderiaceae bacterium]
MSAVQALTAELRSALDSLLATEPEALLRSAASVQAGLSRLQQEVASGLSIEPAQGNEIIDLFEQFSDLLSRSQARTERALLALDMGGGVYRNPTDPRNAGSSVTPRTSRGFRTA